METSYQYTLKIRASVVHPLADNFSLNSWPPSLDFPVVVAANGDVISKFSDSVWNISVWAGKTCSINFADGKLRKGVERISPANALILRQVAAWWLWGPGSVTTSSGIISRISQIKPLFIKCSAAGVDIVELSNRKELVDRLCGEDGVRNKLSLLHLLHGLFENRNRIGFVLFDREALRRLSGAARPSVKKQTPYVPPRIWSYQLERLNELLKDFDAHRTQIEACYHFCLNAYAQNAGSLEEACRPGRPYKRRPFNAPRNCTGTRSGASYIGKFAETAEHFGISKLLLRWTNANSHAVREFGIRDLSAYMTMVSYSALAYILNFSLMRIQEAWFLRQGCLQVEEDEKYGEIYVIRGATSKTIQDDNAAWIAAPSTAMAVSAAECIARLRITAAAANPEAILPPNEIDRPFLFQRPHEPWTNSKNVKDVVLRFSTTSYSDLIDYYSQLFSPEQLCITEEDLSLALLATPSLDPNIFAVGKRWHFAWHQLRRTGAVNMRASRLVSSSSLQYQLKHEAARMSLYYSQGHTHILLERSAHAEYVRATYDVLALKLNQLLSEKFISPYGQDQKDRLLKLVTEKDHAALLKASKAGEITWRETMLGGCCKRGPCSYGGVDNIIRCGGGDGKSPCSDALFDRSRLSAIRSLKSEIEDRLRLSPAGSPYHTSLEKQLQAVKNAIKVLSDE